MNIKKIFPDTFLAGILGGIIGIIWGLFLVFVVDDFLMKSSFTKAEAGLFDIILSVIIITTIGFLLSKKKKAPYSLEKDMHQSLIDNGNIVVGEEK